MGGGKATPAPRMNGGVAPSRGRSDLPVLFRHARSGVPSSVASSHDIIALGLTLRGRPPLPAGVFGRSRILTRKRRKEGVWPRQAARSIPSAAPGLVKEAPRRVRSLVGLLGRGLRNRRARAFRGPPLTNLPDETSPYLYPRPRPRSSAPHSRPGLCGPTCQSPGTRALKAASARQAR
jgi:hypothetical protein